MLDRLARKILEDTFAECRRTGALPLEGIPEFSLERPKRQEHGDFATNVCLSLARTLQRSPREIADVVVRSVVDPDGLLESAQVAGPGFVNLRFRRDVWFDALAPVPAADTAWGCTEAGGGRKVLLEFVSANPTGPLHVGHGRGAVVGDVLGRVMAMAGYDVTREYYINDVGKQMWHLGASLYHRYRALCGVEEPYPDTCYQGEYVWEFARQLQGEVGDSLRDADYAGDEATGERFRRYVSDRVLEDIRADLEAFNIRFDTWFAESALYAAGKVYGLLDELERRGHMYKDETGARKFRTTAFGDDDDRVVIRENGVPTYFASDIAYHHDKFQRGFETLIDVWGADHHGYIPRMKASVAGMGHDPNALEIVLVQLVNLLKDGQPVKFSKRAGNIVDLRFLREEVGADASRFFFIMRRHDSQLDFDLGLAKSQSLDNPVYYVQYGHARIASILRKAAEAGHGVPAWRPEMASALRLPEELELARQVLAWPGLIEGCALNREPHHVVFYLQDVIKTFHGYYTRYKHTEKIVSDDPEKRDARLFLVNCLRIVLRNALGLLGVAAPDRMYPPAGVEDDEA